MTIMKRIKFNCRSCNMEFEVKYDDENFVRPSHCVGCGKADSLEEVELKNGDKIVIKDNFNRELFTEKVIAENIPEFYGELIVQALNDKHWTETSDHYYALVDETYEPYDGYKQLLE